MWQITMEAKGLKINSTKTGIIAANKSSISQVNIRDVPSEEVKKVETFRYLGTAINLDISCQGKVKTKVKGAWTK